MALIVAIGVLSIAVVLVVMGAVFPIVDEGTISTAYKICPLH